MSVDVFENREQFLRHRAAILEAEFSHINGETSYSIEEVRRKLKEKYANAWRISFRNPDAGMAWSGIETPTAAARAAVGNENPYVFG